MAIAIPLLMAATGATAAISTAIGLTALAGATIGAAIVGVGTGLLMAKSGLGSKIDQAASKVFGEDLVKAGNIAGSIYLAMGAPGMTGGAPSADTAGSFDVSGAAAAPDAMTSSFTDLVAAAPVQQVAAQGGGLLADAASMAAPSFDGLTKATGNSFQSAAQNLNPVSMTSAPASAIAPVAAAPASGSGILASMTDKLKNLSPQSSAELIKLGGSMISGAAQGSAREAEIEQARKDRDLRTSGSGIYGQYQWQPRTFVPAGGN